MRYVTAKIQAVERAGLSLLGRTRAGREVVLNEKEVANCGGLTGDFNERVRQLGGTVYTHNEITNIISNNKQI